MANPRTKSSKVAGEALGKMLYVENDGEVLAAQCSAFEKEGYSVETAQGRGPAEHALRKNAYDIVVLGHTLSKDDRHHLPYMAKKLSEETAVLVLHASGKHPAVDFAMDSRTGEQAVLKALKSLVREKALAAVS